MRFGIAMSPFITSAKFHTISSSVIAPMNTTQVNTMRYGITPPAPTSRSMQRSP